MLFKRGFGRNRRACLPGCGSGFGRAAAHNQAVLAAGGAGKQREPGGGQGFGFCGGDGCKGRNGIGKGAAVRIGKQDGIANMQGA